MDIIMDKHTILKHFLLAVTFQRYIFVFYLSESKTKIFLLRFQKRKKERRKIWRSNMKYLSIRINLFINPISNSTIARGFSSYKNEDNKKEERWDEGRNNVERSLPSGCRVAQLKFSVKFLIYPETLAGGHPRGRATNGISPSNFFPGETVSQEKVRTE